MIDGEGFIGCCLKEKIIKFGNHGTSQYGILVSCNNQKAPIDEWVLFGIFY